MRRPDRALAALLVGGLLFAGACSRKANDRELHVVWAMDVPSLDPNERFDVVTATVASNVFEPLVRYDRQMAFEPCLASTVKAVEEHGLTPGHIVFEVVESDRAPDTDQLTRILGFYRKRGFQVALDDLGAGYSSLGLMNRLRPDYVKLDMEIIRDVDTDPYKAQLAMKLLEAARELGVGTVAEGVETAGEYAWVKAHGADYVQGYYVARPATPPPAITRR